MTPEKHHWRIYKVVLEDGKFARIDYCECDGQAHGTFVVNESCPIHKKAAA